jgi:hypothetical protein
LLATSGLGSVVVAVVAMVPVGLGFGLVESSIMGVIPRLADDAVIGRVYGLCELMHGGVGVLGAALAPALIHAVGVDRSLEVVGVGYGLIALLTVRRCITLDRGQHVANRVRELLHAVPFLRPLPLPQLERLVRSARRLAVPAGEPVVRVGDIGDEFYIVDDGEVEVIEFGRRLGPGEGFGEIALLRDVPRTATVRAVTDSHLWTIARESFLAAVGRDDDARSAADAVIDEHLSRPQVDPSL